MLCAVFAALPGCRAGGGNFTNENDRLRRENLALSERVEKLDADVRRLETALAIAQREGAAGDENLPEGVAVPVCAEIRIGKYSGGVDTDGDEVDDALRVYLVTFDQRGRFVQVIGSVRLTAVATVAGESAVTLVTHEMDAKSLDEAYRSGAGGTHYTLTCGLEALPGAGVERVMVHAMFRDARTGHEHTAEAMVRCRRPME